MKNYHNFLGIDVSKNTLDYCLLNQDGKVVLRGKISNSSVSISKEMKKLLSETVLKEELLVVYEYTGIYSCILSQYLHSEEFAYSEVAAIEIKRSRGLSRGKSDEIDAEEIAGYAKKHLERITLSCFAEPVYQQLKLMNAEREKLIAAIGSFERSREAEEYLGKEVYGKIKTLNRQTVTFLKKKLSELERQMQILLRSDEQLKKQQDLVRSIPGIGEIGSVYLLLATKGFTRFKTWRKFACYCGVAPFERSSGSSIRGKHRVSPFADKKLKSLLHMFSLTAIKYDPELRQYYQRKKEEGKHSMLVLNNIKCKLVGRIFAVIERGTPFVKMQTYSQ